MYHQTFFTDRRKRVRPDLRSLALHAWRKLPIEPGYVWRSAGPSEGVNDGPGTVDMGGLVCTIAVEPSEHDHVVFGSRGGGVWRSTDAGATWVALGDGLPCLQTVAVSLSERAGNDPILIAGAGELGEEKLRNCALLGAFRSVDGGKTWSTLDGGNDASIFRSHDVNRVLAIDENRILVATRVGLFFSNDGGRNFGDDAQHRNGKPMLRGDVTDLHREADEIGAVVSGEPSRAHDPRPPELTWQLARPADQRGLWTATLSADSISTFSLLHATVGLVADPAAGLTRLARTGPFWAMSVAKLEIPRNTFAEIDAIRTPGPTSHPHHSIQITRNAVDPTAWHVLPRANVRPAQTAYSHNLLLEPSSVATEVRGWFGTVQLFRTRARDTGAGWTWVSSTERGTDTEQVHVDQHAMVSIGTGPGTFRTWIGNDGGVFRTDNAGAAWTARNKHATFLMWSVSLARKSATEAWLLVGVQDNGTFIGRGPFDPAAPSDWSWNATGPGDGGNNTFVPRSASDGPGDDPRDALITANGHIIRKHATGAGVWPHSTPATLAAGFDAAPVTPGFIYSGTIALGRGPAGEWDRIFFGRSSSRNGPGRLFRQDAGGAVTTVPAGGGDQSAMITALACAPSDATVEAAAPGEWNDLWFGLANGELWFSDDAGSTATRVTVTGALNLPITGIAIDPEDSQRVVVVYGGFSETPHAKPTKKVFLSTNRGASFRDISGVPGPNGFVPDIPVLNVSFTRTAPLGLLISTDLGVLFTSGTLGDAWHRLDLGLPKAPCSAISVLNSNRSDPVPDLANGLPPVAVATFGRGAFLLVRPTAAEAVIEFDGGFGAMKVGSAARRTMTVHNVGNAALSLSPVSASGIFSFEPIPPETTAITAPISIPARGTKQWLVVCQPTAAGIITDTLDVNGVSVPVSCEAFADGPPRLALWPRSINFGEVPAGTPVDATLHIANRGQSDLEITRISTVGTASTVLSLQAGFDVNPSTPPARTLSPGEEIEVVVRFAASGATADHSTTWRIECNDPVDAVEHQTLQVDGRVNPGAVDEGLPDWVPWAIGIGIGVLVVGAGIAIGVAVAESDDD